MFKRSLFFTLMAGVTLTGGSALASDGTITFIGSISANSCTVGGGTASTFTVNLPPNISAATLASEGAIAGAVPFNITLTDCSAAATKAATYFEAGSATDIVTNDLKNVNGDATNVEVRITNADDGSQIKMGAAPAAQNSHEATIDSTSKSAVLRYFAQYRAIGGGATAGSVSTQVTYSITYP